MSPRLLLVLTVFSFLIFYTYLGVARLLPEGTASWLLTLALLGFLIGAQMLERAPFVSLDWLPVRVVVWAGAILMGFWASFVILSIIVDIAVLALRAAFLIFSDPGLAWAEWTRAASLWVLALSLLITIIGLAQAVAGPKVRRIRIPLDGLPAALAGLRIAQISDLHIGATIRRAYMENVVRRTLALAPDLVAITGDLADGHPEKLRAQAAPLSRLRAPLGSYFITGNHEYYSGAEAWIAEMARLGLTALVNEGRVVTHNGERIVIAGVTDLSAAQFIPAHRSEPQKALGSHSEGAAFRLLLAHQPESCLKAEPLGFDLQLSGHTHAGQFFPFNLVVALAKRYWRGLNRHGRMWVYVSAGTGYWGAANRFLVPAEITLLTLDSA